MHCGRVSNLLSAYIDRELAGTDMLQIRHHLSACPTCSTQHEALCRVKSLLAGAQPPEPSGDMVAAVMQRWLERQGEGGARSCGVDTAARRWNWNWRVPWLCAPIPWQRFGMAMTSACLALALVGTAMALRKPKYPNTLAANVLPSLSQTEEELLRSDPPYEQPGLRYEWSAPVRSDRWEPTPPVVPQPQFISETYPSYPLAWRW